MKRTQLVSHGSLNRLLQKAESARVSRDFQECAEILERASRLDPGNPNILLNLGHAHGLRFDYLSAEQCFEKAFRLTPKKSKVLADAGLRARDFGNYILAERYYRLAAEQKDVSPDTLVRLGEICERLSQPAEAVELAKRALHQNRHFPSALLLCARLEKQAGRMQGAESILNTFPQNADPEMQSRRQYQLGEIFDRTGRYEEAMAAFQKAKSLLRSGALQAIKERQIMRSRLQSLRESLTPEILKRWYNSGSILQPAQRLAILCGHPRSGTTLLEQVLDSHPDAVSAEETDIFFNEAFLPLTRKTPDAPLLTSLESAFTETLLESRQNFRHAIEVFLGNPVAERLLIDKNPYLTYLIAPVVRIFPESKFIVTLRDPRDVCLSCFMQSFVPVGQTNSAYLSLEDTVQEYIESMTMFRTIEPTIEAAIIKVRYEDMVENLESVSRRVLNSLGLKWDACVLRFSENAQTKIVRSPTYADVTRPVFKRAVGRWRHYERYLTPYKETLAPFVKAFGYD